MWWRGEECEELGWQQQGEAHGQAAQRTHLPLGALAFAHKGGLVHVRLLLLLHLSILLALLLLALALCCLAALLGNLGSSSLDPRLPLLGRAALLLLLTAAARSAAVAKVRMAESVRVCVRGGAVG